MIKINRDDEYDFLYTSYVLEYSRDNYHRLDNDIMGELEQGVRNLRRRYNNQMDYIEAISKYNEYMVALMDKHGGKKLFKTKYKAGEITEFIPHKPRMKNTKTNRFLMDNKIILSDTGSVKMDMEGVIKTASNIHDDINIVCVDELDKHIEKLIDKGIVIRDGLSAKDYSNIDYIEAYFANKRKKSKKLIREKNDDEPTLTDYLEGNVVDDNDIAEDNNIIYYQGSMMNRENIKQMKLMEEMKDMGWNSLKIMRKSLSKNKAVTKIMKKRKKKIKKISKKKAKEYSSFASDILSDNTSFQDFEDDMLDFTSNNIFK